jgi:hypothetical protein
MNGSKEDDLVKRLKAHPILTARFEALLKLADNTRGDVITANEAERQTIEGVRNLGHELLQDWAQQRVKASVKELKAREQNLKGHGKKK